MGGDGEISSLLYRFHRGRAENGTHKMMLLHCHLKLLDEPLFGSLGEVLDEKAKGGV